MGVIVCEDIDPPSREGTMYGGSVKQLPAHMVTYQETDSSARAGVG